MPHKSGVDAITTVLGGDKIDQIELEMEDVDEDKRISGLCL